MRYRVFLILLLALLALPGCIGVSADVSPQGVNTSEVVLAVPLDRPYTFRQPDPDQRLTAQGGFLRAQVVSVHDGDTITVQLDDRKEKVRLIGIDAPELDQTTRRGPQRHPRPAGKYAPPLPHSNDRIKRSTPAQRTATVC